MKDQQIKTNTTKTSKLDLFSLDFEYDKTIQQIKRDVRVRTDKKS